MKLFLLLTSAVLPLLMVILQKKWKNTQNFFHLAALISSLIFGNISAFAIYDIIKDESVFMTNIHGIFLNPLFLLTGGYLGIYLLYILILQLKGRDN